MKYLIHVLTYMIIAEYTKRIQKYITCIGLPGSAVPIELKKNFQLAFACNNCSMQSNPASKMETPDQ